MSTPEEWFKNLTPIAKIWLCAAVITTVGVSFGFIDLSLIYLDYYLVFKKLQIWRLITNFLFFGKFSFSFIIQMFILVQYTKFLEETEYRGSRGMAELIFAILFGMIGLLGLNWILGLNIPFLASSLSFIILYIWSRKNPYQPVNFWGFQFHAWYLPFVFAIFQLLIGQSPVLDIMGIVIGHLYHFLNDIVPRVYGKEIIRCPQFLIDLFQDTPTIRNDWRGTQANRLN